MIWEHELNVIVRAFEKFIVPISIMKRTYRVLVLAIVKIVVWILLLPYEFLVLALVLFC